MTALLLLTASALGQGDPLSKEDSALLEREGIIIKVGPPPKNEKEYIGVFLSEGKTVYYPVDAQGNKKDGAEPLLDFKIPDDMTCFPKAIPVLGPNGKQLIANGKPVLRYVSTVTMKDNKPGPKFYFKSEPDKDCKYCPPKKLGGPEPMPNPMPNPMPGPGPSPEPCPPCVTPVPVCCVPAPTCYTSRPRCGLFGRRR